jgi:putative glutamine amidotransferase
MNQPIPRVAVPARLASSDGHDPRVAGANKIFFDILDLMRAAGMEPVVVEDPEADLSGVSGLVLPGGGDIDPNRYGGRSIPEVYDVNPEQDALDFAIAERALARRLPVYGICRGAQVLNVIYGGTLYEDLAPSSVVHTPPETPGLEPEEFVSHDVVVEAGTLLAQSLDRRAVVSIQSAHHQAIRQLGTGLAASAYARDGLTEAFEDRERWVLGVQWHPEVEAESGPVRDGQFAELAAEIRRRGLAAGDASPAEAVHG